MPNWCENTLTVTGPAEDLAAFKKKIQGRGVTHDLAKKERNALPIKCFSLNSIVPQPKLPGDGWYNWRLAHWGTMWDVDARIISEDAKSIVYAFDSAWSPPSEWVVTASTKFPTLSFRLWYAEGGCDFGGVFTAEAGSGNDDPKDFLTAQLEENGQYTSCCEFCDRDVEIFTVEDERVCDECKKHMCVRCGKHEDRHSEGKCLFEPTEFKPREEG